MTCFVLKSFSQTFGQAFDGLHPNSKGLQPTSDGFENV